MKSYKLVLNQIPFEVEIEETKDGEKQIVTKIYTVREMPGYLRDAYQADMYKRYEKKADGKIDITKMAGAKNDLLSRCLFDETGKLVREDVYTNWPGGMLEDLFKDAQDLNKVGLSKKEQEEQVEKIKKDLAESVGTGLPSQ